VQCTGRCRESAAGLCSMRAVLPGCGCKQESFPPKSRKRDIDDRMPAAADRVCGEGRTAEKCSAGFCCSAAPWRRSASARGGRAVEVGVFARVWPVHGPFSASRARRPRSRVARRALLDDNCGIGSAAFGGPGACAWGTHTPHRTSMMTWTRRECLGGLKMFMRMMSEYRRYWRPDNNREACVGWTSVLLYSILGRWIYLWMMLSRLTSPATAVAAVAAAAAPCEAEVAEIAASA
jgi:hypothetical protein